MRGDVTNALPAAGVGNDSRNARSPKESARRGEMWRKSRQEKKGDHRETWWLGNRLWVENPKSPCNYILIMHQEGFIRDFCRLPPDT